jgi:hypothetical protein
VAWNPALTQYDLPQEEGLVLPDTLAQAAERRRHLLHTLASDPKMQAHFAMPSNSFFMPPEYVSVNCWLPGCWLSGGGLNVPVTAYVGQPLSMTTSISAFGPDCWPIFYDWFIDGQYLTSGSNATSHSISHTPQSTGTHTVETYSYCGCDMFALVRNKTYTASNPPPPQPSCSGIGLTVWGLAYAKTIGLRIYERGTSLKCEGGIPAPYALQKIYNEPGDEQCQIVVTRYENDIAWVHTHPLFIQNNTYTCNGEQVTFTSMSQLEFYKDQSENFSPMDISFSSAEYPGFLHTSWGNARRYPLLPQ